MAKKKNIKEIPSKANATDLEIDEEVLKDEMILEIENESWNLEEALMGTSSIDPIVEKTPIAEKQHEMFYNLEEGRIKLEEQEREKAAIIKAKEIEAEKLEREKNEGKPKLTCPFCHHVQYYLNSKDVTTSWCMSCGRAFMVNWV